MRNNRYGPSSPRSLETRRGGEGETERGGDREIRGILFKLCYQLRGHRWNGWPLDYWLSFILILVAGLASLGVIPGHSATTCAAVAGCLVLWGVLFWARRNQYVVFLAEHSPGNPGAAVPLRPNDKIKLRATGRFEVEGKEHAFTELLAYVRTFATREHAAMAIVPPSRFLLLGAWPQREVGMWYIFFRPDQILSLTPGTLYFGRHPRLALRVVYRQEEKQRTVYLSFDTPADRRRVWADLQKDAALTMPRA